jgi:hypothetical protein
MIHPAVRSLDEARERARTAGVAGLAVSAGVTGVTGVTGVGGVAGVIGVGGVAGVGYARRDLDCVTNCAGCWRFSGWSRSGMNQPENPPGRGRFVR